VRHHLEGFPHRQNTPPAMDAPLHLDLSEKDFTGVEPAAACAGVIWLRVPGVSRFGHLQVEETDALGRHVVPCRDSVVKKVRVAVRAIGVNSGGRPPHGIVVVLVLQNGVPSAHVICQGCLTHLVVVRVQRPGGVE
jgi:hypothetical protein